MPRGGCDEVDSPNRVRSEDDGLPRWLICCGGADESDKDLLGTSSLVSSFDRFRCLKCSPWVHVWEGGGGLFSGLIQHLFTVQTCLFILFGFFCLFNNGFIAQQVGYGRRFLHLFNKNHNISTWSSKTDDLRQWHNNSALDLCKNALGNFQTTFHVLATLCRLSPRRLLALSFTSRQCCSVSN